MSTWRITSDGIDAYLHGPGNLRITLKHFNPAKVEHVGTLPGSILGHLFQESLRYPVAPAMWLHLVTTSATERLDAERSHLLFLGEHCR